MLRKTITLSGFLSGSSVSPPASRLTSEQRWIVPALATSINASSTTKTAQRLASFLRSSAECATPVGLVGFPMMTIRFLSCWECGEDAFSCPSASAGVSVYGGGSASESTSTPAARNAASGSVNCGWTMVAGKPRCGKSENPSATPWISSTSSALRLWLAAMVARTSASNCTDGYAASSPRAAASESCNHCGVVPWTLTAKSRSAPWAAWSP